MSKARQLLIILTILLTLTNCAKISFCIPNTSCQCLLTAHSFTLINCSYSLPNLPKFNSNTSMNITEIIARNALIHWPTHLCQYSRIHILDLSGSYFHSQSIDLSCLYDLIYLNLSRTELKTIPNFQTTFLRNLQILDLSNNQLEILDGNFFRLLKNLIELYLQNNPFKQVDHFEYFLSLPRLRFLNFISSNSSLSIRKPLTVSQWINLASKWKNNNRTLIIQTNTIALQSIFPSNSNQFQLISLDLMKIIFRTLANSTFIPRFSAPNCTCADLRNYQRVFSLSDLEENLSPLFRSSTCLMPNGIIHAPLFDRRTLVDLDCLITRRKLSNSCFLSNYQLFLAFLFILFV